NTKLSDLLKNNSIYRESDRDPKVKTASTENNIVNVIFILLMLHKNVSNYDILLSLIQFCDN
ncbi:MAG: hypothetical protein US97_C0044G0016, partial [Microgenomates group bacterium GW2011_GWF1_38_5]